MTEMIRSNFRKGRNLYIVPPQQNHYKKQALYCIPHAQVCQEKHMAGAFHQQEQQPYMLQFLE